MNKKNEKQKITESPEMSANSKKRRKLLGAIAAGGAADYTFALVTGSVSAVATFTGSGRGFYTFLSSTGTQFAPYIFDTTCAG